jgi:hypothetical protein
VQARQSIAPADWHRMQMGLYIFLIRKRGEFGRLLIKM